MSTTIVSSSHRLFGHNPIHYDGSAYYTVTIDDTNNYLHVYKASSPTGTWSEVDSADSPTDFAMGGSDGPLLSSLLDSSGYLHILATRSTDSLYYYQFNTNTDQWTTGLPTFQYYAVNEWAQDKTGTFGSICELGNGNIVITYTGFIDSYHGDDKMRIDYIESSDNGATWGSETTLDSGGDVHYGDPTCAPGATSTEFHCYAQRQTSTADDPPTGWSSTWLTGNTSNSPTAGSASYDTGAFDLRGFKALVETNDTNEFRAIGANGANVIHHVLNEANPIAEITANDSSVTPAKSTAESATPSGVAESDGSKLYIVYPDSSTSDIYLLTATAADDALDSTTATEIFDGVTATYISVSLVSTDLIVVWDSGSSVEVDTYSIAEDADFLPYFGKRKNVLLRM
jgi:hypothetical protein